MPEDVIAGRYRLHEQLGRGAMSTVWLAEDAELARRVAVKTLVPSADRARFEREARAAAALSHPNICSLYDYGESEGRPYMVLEYLEGGSLEDRLRGGRLSDDDALRIATEIASGLAHAHERGLVHRDLKPANVLFDTEERAKIADFGIARLHGSGTLTEAGTVLGTASYISPEQAAGDPAGPQSDVYSFGVILFRMLTGALPFVSTNAMELVRMHRDDPPPAVGDVRPDAPARLAQIVDASLAKDPARRPADGAALLSALRDSSTDPTLFVAPAQAAATQVIRAPARTRRTRALPIAAIVAAVLLLAGGVAAAIVFTGGGGSDSHTTTTRPLSLPTVATAGSTSTQATTTAEQTTTAETTTAPTTTAKPTTTAAPTTTAHPTTTAPSPTVLPTTTVAPPPTTTETLPTTTEPLPTTTDTGTITVP